MKLRAFIIFLVMIPDCGMGVKLTPKVTGCNMVIGMQHDVPIATEECY